MNNQLKNNLIVDFDQVAKINRNYIFGKISRESAVKKIKDTIFCSKIMNKAKRANI